MTPEDNIKQDIETIKHLSEDSYLSGLKDFQRELFKILEDQSIIPELQGRVIKLKLDEMILKAEEASTNGPETHPR